MTLPLEQSMERERAKPIEEMAISFMVARGFTQEDAVQSVEHYYQLVSEYPSYALALSAVTDAFRDARVAFGCLVSHGFITIEGLLAMKAEQEAGK